MPNWATWEWIVFGIVGGGWTCSIVLFVAASLGEFFAHRRCQARSGWGHTCRRRKGHDGWHRDDRRDYDWNLERAA